VSHNQPTSVSGIFSHRNYSAHPNICSNFLSSRILWEK